MITTSAVRSGSQFTASSTEGRCLTAVLKGAHAGGANAADFLLIAPSVALVFPCSARHFVEVALGWRRNRYQPLG